jgi:hypothetical protein
MLLLRLLLLLCSLQELIATLGQGSQGKGLWQLPLRNLQLLRLLLPFMLPLLLVLPCLLLLPCL